SIETAHAQAFDGLCGKLLWNTLNAMSVFREKTFTVENLEGQAAYLPFYRRWMRETLAVLQDHGYLERHGDSYRLGNVELTELDTLWREWAQQKAIWHNNAYIRSRMTLVEACMKSLPHILSGQRAATEVMFPGSSMDLIEGIYKGNAVSDLFN